MKKSKPVILITGPTASGKTGTSIALAKQIQQTLKKEATIVNFDSLLFYQELNIGTAKPSFEEMQNIPHCLVGNVSAKHNYNASEFVKDAEKIIEDLHKKNHIVILVGGSGFYVRALLKGMYQSGPTPPEVRDSVENLYQSEGIASIREFLKQHDPDAYEHLHENDHYRNIRAMEFFQSTGRPISKQKKVFDQNDPYDFTQNRFPDWNLLHCHLDLPKDEHLQIIATRTEKMLKDGLLGEVKALLASGFTGEERPLRSIGYKEVIDFLGHKIPETELVDRINISTRQLAKAQRTFFKKCLKKRTYHPLSEQETLVADALEFLAP